MALLDQFGRKIRRNKPILEEVAVQTVRDRYSTYPSHGLTPERLATILKEADQGDIYRQAELFEEMEEKDWHLGSVLQSRKLAVQGLTWEILPAVSDSAEDKKIAEAAVEMIEYIENWDDALLDILDAIGRGFSVCEIMWDISEGQVWIEELKWVHQKRFTFNSKDKLLDVPRLLTDDEQVWGEELLPNKFVYHRYKARSGAVSRGGILRPCTYLYLFKNYDIKDWLIFNELYSVPMRVGKYRPGAGKDEIEKLKQAVFNLGVDAAAVLSDSTVIELLESSRRGDVGAFKELAEYCDRAMSKVVLGHTGSADSTPGRLGSEHEARELRQDLLEADAKALQKTIKFQILQPWVAYNFGPERGIPKFIFHYEAQEDLEKTAKVYGILAKDVGFEDIGVDHIHERFGIPKPKEGEKTLRDLKTVQRAQADETVETITNKAIMVNTAAQLTPEQQSIEGLKASSIENWQEMLEPLIEPIRQIIDESTTLQEARARIMEAFGEMDTRVLTEAMARAMFNADLFGRINATGG